MLTETEKQTRAKVMAQARKADLSANMKDALHHVLRVDPKPFVTGSAPLLKGLAALERRGMVQLAEPPQPFYSPKWILTDAGRLAVQR